MSDPEFVEDANPIALDFCKKSGMMFLYDYSADGHAMVSNYKDVEDLIALVVQRCAELANDSNLPDRFWNETNT